MFRDDSLEAFERLVGFAEGVEQQGDVDVGVGAHRARLRRLVIDLDRRFILLEPAIGFAERIQRQRMIRRQHQGASRRKTMAAISSPCRPPPRRGHRRRGRKALPPRRR